jgi:hypothetical protein
MKNARLRTYLSQILPELADLADSSPATDLGQLAYDLRLLALRLEQGPSLTGAVAFPAGAVTKNYN